MGGGPLQPCAEACCGATWPAGEGAFLADPLQTGRVLHREDGVAGAQRRIRAAGSVLPRFGVATECGMARSPREEIAQLFRQHREALTAAA